MRPLLPPERLWLSIDAVNHALKITLKLILKQKSAVICSSEKFSGVCITSSDHSITAKEPLSQLRQFIEHFKGNVLFSVETEGRRETLVDLLSPLKIKPKQIKTLSEANQDKFNLWVSRLEQGFILDEAKLAVITEHEILGERVQQRQRDKRKAVNPDTLVRNLAELKIGQPVVHLDHGVGRYGGLVTLDTGGLKAEYLLINYANESKLYVPVGSLHLISRYVGGSR